MKEKFDVSSEASESDPRKEEIEGLRNLFAEIENIFQTEGREGAKPRLDEINTKLQILNRSDASDWGRTLIWNPKGDLTEEEFDELNLRRKRLSNAVGIMTASGKIRHDLNEI